MCSIPEYIRSEPTFESEARARGYQPKAIFSRATIATMFQIFATSSKGSCEAKFIAQSVTSFEERRLDPFAESYNKIENTYLPHATVYINI